jgi:hypothetical protein
LVEENNCKDIQTALKRAKILINNKESSENAHKG